MTLEDDIRALSAATLFEHLDQDQLRLLAFGAERVQLTAGQTLYVQNDPAECGYVIVRGEIDLTRRIRGKDVTLDTAAAGEVLGQFALITETERMTGAVARTDAELFRVSRSIFKRMLGEYPDTALAIHDIMRDELSAFLRRITELERSFRKSVDL